MRQQLLRLIQQQIPTCEKPGFFKKPGFFVRGSIGDLAQQPHDVRQVCKQIYDPVDRTRARPEEQG